MKKLAANLIIALGAAVALAGALGTPLLQDYLPVSFMFPAGGQSTHHYRVALGEPQSRDYLPYIALLVGVIILVVGVFFRRRFRGNTA